MKKKEKNVAYLAFTELKRRILEWTERLRNRSCRHMARRKVFAGINSIYEQSSSCVRLAPNVSRCFRANNGVEQGRRVLQKLFNNLMVGVVR